MQDSRNIFISCMLSLFAFVGCGEKIPVIEEEHHIMAFDAMPAHVEDTRSTIENQSQLNTSEGLGLFGTLSYGTGTPAIFNNDRLHYNGSGWTYDYMLFWTKGGFYNFAAVFPYTADATTTGSGKATYTHNNGVVTIGMNDIQADLNTPDVMCGFATRDLTVTEDYSVVPLELNHAFAAVDFVVVNASGEDVTSISDIDLKNIATSGSFTWSSASPKNVSWTAGPVSSASNYTRAGNVLSSALTTGPAQYSLYGGYFMTVPQELYGTSAAISFTKEGGNNENNPTLSLGNITQIRRWEAGHKYTYIITLQSTAITFTVEVVDWIEHRYNLN